MCSATIIFCIPFFFYFSGRQERRGKVIEQGVNVTLEELYNGAVRILPIHIVVYCKKCEGRGAKKGLISTCQKCRGTGNEFRMQQIFPGVVQQVESICRQCSGAGEVYAMKDRCKQCQGKKTIRDRTTIKVHIEKGMQHGQKIVFAKRGNHEDKDFEAGDVIVILYQKKHPVFKRNHSDLEMVMPLILTESLCGFKKIIKSLDNRDLLITNLPGMVIKSGDVKCIMGEGMPHYKNPFEKGRLIIQFKLIFPTHIAPELVTKLEACLPPRPVVDIAMDSDSLEECTLVRDCSIGHIIPPVGGISFPYWILKKFPFQEDYIPSQDNQRRHFQQVYEEDDDGYRHGGTRVQQCTSS